jgi:ADP-heptose:LPS heptosyltransferase
MGTILIIKLGALGDLVQADGALRDIREHHPHDSITVMTTPPYRRYMERCPWVDRVFIDPRVSRFNLVGLLDLRKRLQTLRIERVYDLQQVGRTRFYRRWLFPRVPWLGDTPGCTWRLRRPGDCCAADHFANHLELAGIETRHSRGGDVSWLADDVSDVLRRAGLVPGYIVLIPGASAAHDAKRWPYFPDLAERLLTLGHRVVTVPGPAEMELCRTISGDMLVPDDGYYDVFALAGLIRQAAFVIGNDTGPTHLAAHLRGPGLALFGDHAPAMTTGIQHSAFAWLQAGKLGDLGLETVWPQVARLLECSSRPETGS